MAEYLITPAGYNRRLRYIEGQVCEPQRLIDKDTSWVGFLAQVSLATGLPRWIDLGLRDDQTRHWVLEASAECPECGDAKVGEPVGAINGPCRS